MCQVKKNQRAHIKTLRQYGGHKGHAVVLHNKLPLGENLSTAVETSYENLGKRKQLHIPYGPP